MAHGPRGRSRPTLGGRLPTGLTCGALAVFWGSRWLVGPAALGSYRQVVVGAGFGPLVLMSGPAWQQCHAARRSPRVQRAIAMLPLVRGGSGLYCSHSPVLSLLMRTWDLLESRADSPKPASLEVASQESAYPEVVPGTRPRVGSRSPCRPLLRRRLFVPAS